MERPFVACSISKRINGIRIVATSGIIDGGIFVIGVEHHIVGTHLEADGGFLDAVGLHLLHLSIPTFLTVAVGMEVEGHGTLGNDGELVDDTSGIGGDKILRIGGEAVVNRQLGGVQTECPVLVRREDMRIIGTVVIRISRKLLEGHLDFMVGVFRLEGECVILVTAEPAFPIVGRAGGFAARVVEFDGFTTDEGTRTRVHVHILLRLRELGE